MGTHEDCTVMDLRGLSCPQPMLKLTIELRTRLHPGDLVEVLADCSTFTNDLKSWCARNKKALLWVRDEDGEVTRCRVQI